MVAGGVLIVGGWVDARKAVGHVDWALLLLVGSALGLSKAICNSGLAGYAGDAIRTSGMSASASLYVLYGFTMVRKCKVIFVSRSLLANFVIKVKQSVQLLRHVSNVVEHLMVVMMKARPLCTAVVIRCGSISCRLVWNTPVALCPMKNRSSVSSDEALP